MSYALNLKTAPVEEPVTKAQAKSYIKLDDNITADDSLIEDILIPEARQYLEAYTWRALISQTWEIVFNCGQSEAKLPLGQLTAVNSVTVINEDDSESVQSADLYHTSLNTDRGRVWLTNSSTWSTTERAYDNFVINFTCGWANATAVPAKYRTAILALVAYMYENRQYRDSDLADVLIGQSGVGKLLEI